MAKILLTRGVYANGIAYPAGSEIDVSDADAVVILSANKGVAADEATRKRVRPAKSMWSEPSAEEAGVQPSFVRRTQNLQAAAQAYSGALTAEIAGGRRK